MNHPCFIGDLQVCVKPVRPDPHFPIIGLLALGSRWHVATRTEQAAIIAPVYPFHGGTDGLPRPCRGTTHCSDNLNDM